MTTAEPPFTPEEAYELGLALEERYIALAKIYSRGQRSNNDWQERKKLLLDLKSKIAAMIQK